MHRVWRKLAGVLAALLLLAAPLPAALPARAAAGRGPWLSPAAERAVDWLAQAVPTPGPGDETVLLALLRGGALAPGDAAVAAWAEEAAAGTAAPAPGESAWRALLLAACGRPATAVAPALAAAAAQPDADPDALCGALLLYGPAGERLPAGAEPDGWTAALVAAQGADGSLDGSLRKTARALTALAWYADVAQPAADAALSWLETRQAAYGGFEEDGMPSPGATAEVVVALAGLGQHTLTGGLPAPAEALLVFQNGDGSFSPDPDSPADVALSALCTLALVAESRRQAGMAALFDFSDVVPLVALPPVSEAPAQGGGTDASTPQGGGLPALVLPGLGAVPGALVLGVLALLAGLLVVTVVVAARAKKRHGDAAAERAPPPATGRRPKDLSSYRYTAPPQAPGTQKKRRKRRR